MSEPRTLTVVEMNEWSLLFDGETLAYQGHNVALFHIEQAARGEAIKIKIVDAYGTPFDRQTRRDGDVRDNMTLSEVMPMTKRKRRPATPAIPSPESK